MRFWAGHGAVMWPDTDLAVFGRLYQISPQAPSADFGGLIPARYARSRITAAADGFLTPRSNSDTRTGTVRRARVRPALQRVRHRTPPHATEITANQRHGPLSWFAGKPLPGNGTIQRPDRGGAAIAPFPFRRRPGNHAAPLCRSPFSRTDGVHGSHSYNQQLPQSALGSKTPLQAMKEWHKLKPELFKKQPYYLTGCDS